MPQKTEEIKLEYMVEFEDGLRPKVHVYGINDEEIKGALAYFGVVTGAGDMVGIIAREKEVKDGERPSPNRVQVTTGPHILVHETVHHFKSKVPETDGWEQQLYDCSRTMGFNVIKVQDPEHIQPAIDRHREQYQEQFRPLAEKFMELYQDFIKEHPGYGHF
ncbi:MAG: hypothetical protein AABX29_09900 [Nanoarchaeota archaeon]